MSESSSKNPSLTDEQIARITEAVAGALRKVTAGESCCSAVQSGEDPCCVTIGGGSTGTPRAICICIDSRGEGK